jgi:hypothetical protein
MRDGAIVSDAPVKERRKAADDLIAWRKDHAQLAGERGSA